MKTENFPSLFPLKNSKKPKTWFGTSTRPSLHSPTGWLHSPYAYAFVALVVVVAALGSINYRLAKQLQQERVHGSTLTKELEARQHAVAAPRWGSQDALVLITLRPGGSRDEELQEISVPKGVRAVQFSLPAPADLHGEVLVDLLNDNNLVITTLSGIHRQQIGDKEVFIVTLPRDYLPSGNYFLRVRGLSNPIQYQYSFKVRNR